MCRKKAKKETLQEEILTNEIEQTPVAQPAPVTPRENDYFSEYYKAYKNNYIDQYLDSYHKFKETNVMDDNLRELYGFDINAETEEDKK